MSIPSMEGGILSFVRRESLIFLFPFGGESLCWVF